MSDRRRADIIVRSKRGELFTINGSRRDGLQVHNQSTDQHVTLDEDVMEALAEALHDLGVEHDDWFGDDA
mgnify:CR=1 FL=1